MELRDRCGGGKRPWASARCWYSPPLSRVLSALRRRNEFLAQHAVFGRSKDWKPLLMFLKRGLGTGERFFVNDAFYTDRLPSIYLRFLSVQEWKYRLIWLETLTISWTVKLIREDKTVEAYDILELQCELVAERMRFVDSQKEVPPDMDQAIRTLIWAADRSEVRKSRAISDVTVETSNLSSCGCQDCLAVWWLRGRLCMF